MPSRNSKGQFISDSGNDLYIPLPGFSGLYKLLIIGFVIFPWYVILSNVNISNFLFSYLLKGSNLCASQAKLK